MHQCVALKSKKQKAKSKKQKAKSTAGDVFFVWLLDLSFDHRTPD